MAEALPPRLLSYEGAAAYLGGISLTTLRAMVESGELPPPVPWSRGAVRFDRIALDEALDKMQGRKAPGSAGGVDPWGDVF